MDSDNARNAVAHFREVLSLPTVSYIDESETNWAPFDDFIELITHLYPSTHRVLRREIIAGHALLYRWPGISSARPTVLMAHYDVVNVVPDKWTYPPFSATVTGEGSEERVWARGAIDDKASLISILEAAEQLAAAGFTPANDIYLAFSHNEETLGNGTPTIVATLAERGVRPWIVLDEGGIVGENIIEAVARPAIFVGVSEKGTLTLRLSATSSGGHASVPTATTATVRLAQAIVRLDEAEPAPFFNSATRDLVVSLAPYSNGALARVAALLEDDPAAAAAEFAAISRDTNAMTRTTPVVTMLAAGHTVNVMAELATAIVNTRVAVGSSVEEARRTIIDAVADQTVVVEDVESFEPSPISPAQGDVWDLLRSTIAETYGDVIVLPYVNNGGTDSRNYTAISDHVYRFSPFDQTRDERRSLHGIDEHIRVSSFVTGIGFYERLVARL